MEMPRMMVPALAQEQAGAFDHVEQHVLHPRQAVGRQFHDHERRLALEQVSLEQPREAKRAERAEGIHEQHEARLRADGHAVAREQRGDHQQVDRQPRRAAHQRRHENRHEAVLRCPRWCAWP